MLSAKCRPFYHDQYVNPHTIKVIVWRITEIFKGKHQRGVVHISSSFLGYDLCGGLTVFISLRWRHNELDGVSDHQPHDCLLNRLFRRRSKKTSKLRVTGLCARNSPGTGEFPVQKASNAENVSIWWRHHVMRFYRLTLRVPGYITLTTLIWPWSGHPLYPP